MMRKGVGGGAEEGLPGDDIMAVGVVGIGSGATRAWQDPRLGIMDLTAHGVVVETR